MIILGIDPGLAHTGYGIIESLQGRFRPLAHGVIETGPRTPQPERLREIHSQILDLIKEYKPTSASIEDLFFNKNVGSAFPVAEARGVILLAMAQSRLTVGQYTPLQIKHALVGHGRALKEQVQEMVKIILGLAEIPRPDHAADALAVAVCHVHHQEGTPYV